MNTLLALAESLPTGVEGIVGGVAVAALIGLGKILLGTDKRTAVDGATMHTRLEAHEKRNDERYNRLEGAVMRIESTTGEIRDSVARLETTVAERTGNHSAVQLQARK